MEYLKIKDDVDLKELEKFGFYDCYQKEYRWRHIDREHTIGTEITISVSPSGNIDVGGLCYEDPDSEPSFDLMPLAKILFDLIQAGLIEKVVE